MEVNGERRQQRGGHGERREKDRLSVNSGPGGARRRCRGLEPDGRRSPCLRGNPLTFPAAALLAAALSASTGCIARTLTVESDPPGAEVRLNGHRVGRTPVTVPFLHYGVYDVELRKEGMATLRAEAPVMAPGYARFPVCLFTEFLWPGTIHDDRKLSYVLKPPVTPGAKELLERAERAARGAEEARRAE